MLTKQTLIAIAITFFGTVALCFLQKKFKGQKGGLLKLLGIVAAIILFVLAFWIFINFQLVDRGFSISFNSMEVIKQRFSFILAFFYAIYETVIRRHSS